MVCIKNTPGEDDGYRLKKDSSSGIYMTSVKEDQFRILADNRRKQDEVKQNALQANSIKNSSRIIKQGILFHKILSTVARIYSVTDTTDESTESALQDITPLSFDNLKDAFLHLGGNIHDFPDLKKWTFMVQISKRWGKGIIKEGAMSFLKENYGVIAYISEGWA